MIMEVFLNYFQKDLNILMIIQLVTERYLEDA